MQTREDIIGKCNDQYWLDPWDYSQSLNIEPLDCYLFLLYLSCCQHGILDSIKRVLGQELSEEMLELALDLGLENPIGISIQTTTLLNRYGNQPSNNFILDGVPHIVVKKLPQWHIRYKGSFISKTNPKESLDHCTKYLCWNYGLP